MRGAGQFNSTLDHRPLRALSVCLRLAGDRRRVGVITRGERVTGRGLPIGSPFHAPGAIRPFVTPCSNEPLTLVSNRVMPGSVCGTLVVLV